MKSFFKSLLKESPIESSLSKLSLFEDSTNTLNLNSLLAYYRKQQSQNKQQDLIDILILQLQKKKPVTIKLKILVYLFSISKMSAYDITDLVTRKKLKTFAEQDKKKIVNFNDVGLTEINKSAYVQKFVLYPLYNYMMKLSANQELYKICQNKEVPCDDIFRKGMRIRYIWVFKIFNLINVIKPIFAPILSLLKKFSKQGLYSQILKILKEDLAIYLNFITKCLQQTGVTNAYLLPYNDCLQYYESVKQYQMFKIKNSKMLKEINSYWPEPSITFIQIEQSTFVELEMLAARIQLISNSLRTTNTNNKENERMVTQYNEKVEKYEMRMNTLGH